MEAESRQPPVKFGVAAVSRLFDEVVVQRDDDELHRIRELVIDAEEGRVVHAAVTSGGFLGMGHGRSARPWSASEFASTEHKLILAVDGDKLTTARGFNQARAVARFRRQIVGKHHPRVLRIHALLTASGLISRAPAAHGSIGVEAAQ